MSKSKLNRRQLKKISKAAVNFMIRRQFGYMGAFNWEDVSFGESKKDCDEYVVWYRSDYWSQEYDNEPALEVFLGSFLDYVDYKNLQVSKQFNALSFANKVHYMIKFLEGKQ